MRRFRYPTTRRGRLLASRVVRIAVLWKGVMSFLDAEIAALRAAGDEVALAVLGSSAAHPQAKSALDVLAHTLLVDESTPGTDVATWIEAFDADVVICCGWDPKPFMDAMQILDDTGVVRALYMDNQWLGTLKQRAGILISPWLLRRRFEAVLLPGEPQARFARRLGFRSDQIHESGLVADVSGFASNRLETADWLRQPPAFLYCGRLIDIKGADLLLRAYEQYRASVAEPWALTIAGTGPLLDAAQATQGATALGFVQPDDLPPVMAAARTLVLPSRSEAWGAVVHEAACAGLPLVLSDRVGAGSRFLHHRVNGLRTDAGSVDSLAWAMREVASWDAAQLIRARERSIELGMQLSESDFVAAVHAIGSGR